MIYGGQTFGSVAYGGKVTGEILSAILDDSISLESIQSFFSNPTHSEILEISPNRSSQIENKRSSSLDIIEILSSLQEIARTEQFSLSENRIQEINKQLSNSFEFLEVIQKLIQSYRTSQLTLVDSSFLKNFENRSLLEILTILDNPREIEIDKTLLSEIPFSELSTIHSDYSKTENFGLFDTLSYQSTFLRVLNETLVIAESKKNETVLRTIDLFQISDILTREFIAYYSLSESLSLLDEINLSYVLNKVLSELLEMTENDRKEILSSRSTSLQLSEMIKQHASHLLNDQLDLSETRISNVILKKSDSIEVQDNILFSSGLQIISSIELSESLLKDLKKPLQDETSLNDLITTTVEFTRAFAESMQISESMSRQFTLCRFFYDTVILSEIFKKLIEKPIDEMFVFTTTSTSTVNVALVDITQLSEILNKEEDLKIVDIIDLSALIELHEIESIGRKTYLPNLAKKAVVLTTKGKTILILK